MDTLLCDELLIEIFHRCLVLSSSSPPSTSLSSSSSLPLVSKRWLRIYRLSKTSLSLFIPPYTTSPSSLSSLLSLYPFLTSLSLSNATVVAQADSNSDTAAAFDVNGHLLISAVTTCPNLRYLRFLPVIPISPSTLFSLSSSSHLISLTISLSRPLNFSWVEKLKSLEELSVLISGQHHRFGFWGVFKEPDDDDATTRLLLRSLSISGISWNDVGLGWLWRNSKNLKKLKLKNCEGLGDGGSISSFTECLTSNSSGLEEVELRTCRGIVDGVLLKLSEKCFNLNSLLVYDGGSRQGLYQFITNSGGGSSHLRKVSLRLPLDLTNDHLSAMATKFTNLSSLRLQSCCLVTGQGLVTFSSSMSHVLEELALINCDVVERVPGLLTTMAQNLKRLRKLDLSYNETLGDKEFVSMAISCNCLVDLKLRGCKGLTDLALVALIKSCKRLECVDIVSCCGFEAQGVGDFVRNSPPRLTRVLVEDCKVEPCVKTWASTRFIEIVGV